jgi:transcription-repair coupling factor (superfamily II helicase)
MKEEMRDRFGPLRPEVLNLFSIMETRLAMKKMGITRLDISRLALIFSFSDRTTVKPDKLIKVAEKRRHKVQFMDGNRSKISIRKDSAIDALIEAKIILKDLG